MSCAQPDRGPGEWASVYRSDILVAAGPYARCEPHGQPQQLVSRGISELANLYELDHGIDAAARVVLHPAGKAMLVQDGQPTLSWSRAPHQPPAVVSEEVPHRPLTLLKSADHCE